MAIELRKAGRERNSGLRGVLKAIAGAAMLLFCLGTVPAPIAAQPIPGAPAEGFADLAARLKSSVVNITTAQTLAQPRGPAPEFPPGSPFGDLFNDFFGEDGQPRRVESLGSGFVIDVDGLVVTNNHVIEGAEEINVVFPDGLTLPATLIGSDAETDLAVLQINSPGPFDVASWGDSDAIRVGDWVIAIGNPFGLGGSVSAGIISARGRDIQAGRYDDFLQTDAAINRGNSGGPLFNMAGEVVGVNTAIISPSGGSIGLGFSIPSNLAQDVVAELLLEGAVRRGYLGVRLNEVDEESAERVGLEEPRGVLVGAITRGGPADEGGLQEGDVILSFGGEEPEDLRSLLRLVADAEIGSTVDIELWRDGETLTASVEIGTLDEDVAAAEEETPSIVGLEADLVIVDSVGLGLTALTDELRAQFGVAADVEGVFVATVDPTSSAFEQGLRAGDIIVEAARLDVRTPEEARSIIEAALDAGRLSVLMKIMRGDAVRHVALTFTR